MSNPYAIEALLLPDLADEALASYIPECEPFLSEWCQLDTLHQVALREERWRDAMRLADRKCRVWEGSILCLRIA